MIWKIRWDIAIAIVAFAFLLGLAVRCNHDVPRETVVHERETVRLRPDSLRTATDIPIHPIQHGWKRASNRAAGRDTLHIVQRPIVYALDTTLQYDSLALAPDTISIRHILPVDSFALRIRFSPRRERLTIPYLARDSIYTRIDTIQLSRSSPFDETLSILAAVVGGFILGRALR